MLRTSLSVTILCVFFANHQAIAQTDSDNSKSSARYQSEVVQIETAPIGTREDLVRYLSDQSDSNPLNKLSPYAREQLLTTLVVNSKGEIASFKISDVQAELSPTDALKVFTLFGAPSLAHINNGQIKTPLDSKIQAQGELSKHQVHPATPSYYCNGGYCTENTQMSCVDEKCQPPR